MPVWQGESVRRALLPAAVAALAAVGAYAAALRHRQFQWGATSDEVVMTLPGDELLGRADLVATRAVTVRAEAEDVWPWLAQMGQGRGGLYSYDWVENLVGCQMNSAERVVPKWQGVEVGDDFRIHPDVALKVVHVNPPHALVVEGGVSATGEATAGDADAPYDFTWAFVLVPETKESNPARRPRALPLPQHRGPGAGRGGVRCQFRHDRADAARDPRSGRGRNIVGDDSQLLIRAHTYVTVSK